MEPLISVIIPVYQMEKYLSQCVDSVLQQTWCNLEVLLIDDGSTDQSGVMCDGYQRNDSRVRVIHIANGGIANARNIGIANVSGDLISFVDADDWVELNYLETLYGMLETDTVAMAACNHWIVPRMHVPQPRFPEAGEMRRISLYDAYQGILYHGVPDISPWGKLYRRAVFVGVTYPKGHVFEDTDRIAKVLANAGGIVYTSKPLYHYRFREDSISKLETDERINDFERAVEHMIADIREHFPELETGCQRRRMHAWLSMRRFYVDCPATAQPQRNLLEKKIRQNAWATLKNPMAPKRDKLGIMSVLFGSRAFDSLWKQYCRTRWRQVNEIGG